MEEDRLIDFLEGLTPGDFARVVTRLPGAMAQIPKGVTQPEQVAALIGYLRGPTGPGFEQLNEIIAKKLFLKGNSTPNSNAAKWAIIGGVISVGIGAIVAIPKLSPSERNITTFYAIVKGETLLLAYEGKQQEELQRYPFLKFPILGNEVTQNFLTGHEQMRQDNQRQTRRKEGQDDYLICLVVRQYGKRRVDEIQLMVDQLNVSTAVPVPNMESGDVDVHRFFMNRNAGTSQRNFSLGAMDLGTGVIVPLFGLRTISNSQGKTSNYLLSNRVFLPKQLIFTDSLTEKPKNLVIRKMYDVPLLPGPSVIIRD